MGERYEVVPRIRMASVSRETFRREFVEPAIPCIIEDFIDSWPAKQRWSRSFFRDELGGLPIAYVRAFDGHTDYSTLHETTFADFLERLEAGEPIKHQPFGHPAVDFGIREITADVNWEAIRAFVPDHHLLGISPLNARLWPWVPPYPPQFFIGGVGARTDGHYDFSGDLTFNSCVHGKKRVRLFRYRDETVAALHALSREDLFSPEGEAALDRQADLEGVRGWTTELEEGQTLFMPSRMWHFFKNERVSITFAVRTRGFRDLEGYWNFTQTEHSPYHMFSIYLDIWRRMPFWKRSLWGHAQVLGARPLLLLTKLGMSWVDVQARGRLMRQREVHEDAP